MAEVNVGFLKVKMDLLKGWHPKLCKKKNPTCVRGYDRQFCPSGHCLASGGSAVTLGKNRLTYSVHSRIFFTGALWPLPKKKMGPSQKNKGH